MVHLHRTGIVVAALLALAPDASADVRFVKADAAGGNDGSSWTDAFTDLQSVGRSDLRDHRRRSRVIGWPVDDCVER